MGHSAVRIPVIESERGWGRRIDDHMVCLSVEDAMEFKKEFNAKNTAEATPDWYMVVEGEPETIELTNSQMVQLRHKKRIWHTSLRLM